MSAPWQAGAPEPHSELRFPEARLSGLLAAAEPKPEAYAARSSYYLETLLEYVAKIKNAAVRRDEENARFFAGRMAGVCWSLLRPLNPVVTIPGETELLNRMLNLPVAPDHNAADMGFCLGVVGEPRPLSEIRARALRLAEGVLDVASARAESLKLPLDLKTYLRDGSLHRYLRQEESPWV